MFIIPALGRLRHEDQRTKANVGYIARPCFNKTKLNNKKTQLM
jgi:hypothetical protein